MQCRAAETSVTSNGDGATSVGDSEDVNSGVLGDGGGSGEGRPPGVGIGVGGVVASIRIGSGGKSGPRRE